MKIIFQESEKERLMPSFLAKRVSESHHEASKKLSGLEKTKAFSRPLQSWPYPPTWTWASEAQEVVLTVMKN